MSDDAGDDVFGPLNDIDCEHDVQPIDEHWGRCTKCGGDGFPLTWEAAGMQEPDLHISESGVAHSMERGAHRSLTAREAAARRRAP